MRVRQRGFNPSGAKWRSFQYAMFIRDINMTHNFKFVRAIEKEHGIGVENE